MVKQRNWIVLIVIVNFLLMGIVDAIIVPIYFVKSLIKIILFAGIPMIFYWKEKDGKELFVFNKQGFKQSVVLGVLLVSVIVGGYFITKDIFDFSNITTSLTGDIGVNVNNFLFVSLYITFINSFLEEFFFRGFAFLTLKKYSSVTFSFLFSSLVFALYHIAMMITWVSLPLLLLATIGLFIGGCIFNYFNYRYKNMYASWIIHIFANIAINSVGFILFLS